LDHIKYADPRGLTEQGVLGEITIVQEKRAGVFERGQHGDLRNAAWPTIA
jgi:hypothetical protein